MTERKLSRRDFLKLTGAAGAALGLSACGVELPRSPERRKDEIEWGFNTHLSANPSSKENLTINAFKEDVDSWRELGMKWVRFNVKDWELQDQDLAVYEEAVDYAKENGLKVFLVTNVPEISENFSDIEGDLAKTQRYYEGLVGRWRGKVDVWQVFNEPDDHRVDRYNINPSQQDPDRQYPVGYLENLSRLVDQASKTIKKTDSNAKVTVNASMWQMVDRGIQDEEIQLFDAVCQFSSTGRTWKPCETLDYITLDLYPDTDPWAISYLPNQVEFFSKTFGIPVIVGEMGMPTDDGRFSEADQGWAMANAIDSLQRGRVRPEAVLLYQYRDEPTSWEESFGFAYADGTPKSGFNQVMEAIQVDEEEYEQSK